MVRISILAFSGAFWALASAFHSGVSYLFIAFNPLMQREKKYPLAIACKRSTQRQQAMTYPLAGKMLALLAV
jgi:hypothetical protein